MSNSIKNLAKSIYGVMNESNARKVKPYDVKAEVLRDDGNIVWVKIPGGIDETPVQKTNNATPGDTVLVRVAGGRAWIAGNNTSPATDDTRANQAYDIGANAEAIADIAIKEAGRASEAANLAELEAGRAQTAASEADSHADKAEESANNAKQSADIAFKQLGFVENIVGVLELVSKNGVYKPTQDTEAILDKWYFERTGTNPDYIYNAVTVATTYILTTDTEIVEGKIYYTRSGSAPDYIYTPVENPVIEDIGSYYEAHKDPTGLYELTDINKSIQNYVSSHLVLDNKGLWLKSNSPDSKIFISAETGKEGVYLFAGDIEPVAQYTKVAVIGKTNDFHIEIGSKNEQEPEIGFYRSTNRVAYLNEQELYVANRLSFGHFTFVERTNGHFSLRLIRS